VHRVFRDFFSLRFFESDFRLPFTPLWSSIWSFTI